MDVLPRWADVVLIPLISVLLAFLLSAVVILAIGEDPIFALKTMVTGALASTYGWGYTLYYATDFMFTGLAVAVAFHARLFNIGGEGQAMLGGLGVAVIALAINWPHWLIALPVAILAGALFGAAWAAIPAYLQAKRGSHIVITTIMTGTKTARSRSTWSPSVVSATSGPVSHSSKGAAVVASSQSCNSATSAGTSRSSESGR